MPELFRAVVATPDIHTFSDYIHRPQIHAF